MQNYQLTRDEKIIFIGDENECYHKLQKLQPFSFHHAMKYEGWEIKKYEQKKNKSNL